MLENFVMGKIGQKLVVLPHFCEKSGVAKKKLPRLHLTVLTTRNENLRLWKRIFKF